MGDDERENEGQGEGRENHYVLSRGIFGACGGGEGVSHLHVRRVTMSLACTTEVTYGAQLSALSTLMRPPYTSRWQSRYPDKACI